MSEHDGTDLETLASLYDCVRELMEHRDRLQASARESFLQSLSDEAQYEENYERRLAAEQRLRASEARVDWLWRAFKACNEDRRFAWRELQHENEVSTDGRKEIRALERRVETLQAALEMERRVNLASGCPDCGVHDGCAQVVAERNHLREVVAAVEAHWERVTVLDAGDPHAKSIDEWFTRLRESE